VNSRSEIAKMFEKGEKYDKDYKEKEIKRDENRKDIVDDYVMLNQNIKGEKSKMTEKNINTSVHNITKDPNNYNKANNSYNKVNKNAQAQSKMFQSRMYSSIIHNSPNMHKNTSGLYR
jgi:hypothetical protein